MSDTTITPEEHRATAYHEAGHAVFCWRYSYRIVAPGVTIDDHGGHTYRRTEVPPGQGWKTPKRGPGRRFLEFYVQREVEITIGGPRAERRFWQREGSRGPIRLGWRSERESIQLAIDERPWEEPAMEESVDDVANAVRLLTEVMPSEKIPHALRMVRDRATRLLRHPRTWAAVEAVADALLDQRRLDPDTVDEIVERVNPPHQRFMGPA